MSVSISEPSGPTTMAVSGPAATGLGVARAGRYCTCEEMAVNSVRQSDSSPSTAYPVCSMAFCTIVSVATVRS